MQRISPDLFARLDAIAEARAAGAGAAHDILHVRRVVASAKRIAVAEGADLDVVLPAALLHELFNYPKGHPDSRASGDVCAEHAVVVLRAEGCPDALIEPIAACIRDHAFSKGVLPATIEGKVVQDADRLDAIGAIGVARCMATCEQMGRPFYSPVDPFASARASDEKLWGIDHFATKLFKIPAGLHTATARRLAGERVRFMEAFLAQLGREIA